VDVRKKTAATELWQRDGDHSSVRIAFSNLWTQLVVSQHSAGMSSSSQHTAACQK